MLILEWQYVFFNKPGQMSILFGVAYLISTQASFIFPSNNFRYLHGNVLERRVSMSRCSVFIQTFLITKSSKSMNQVGRCCTNIVQVLVYDTSFRGDSFDNAISFDALNTRLFIAGALSRVKVLLQYCFYKVCDDELCPLIVTQIALIVMELLYMNSL